MSRRSPVTTPALVLRHLRSRVSTSIALGLLIAVAVALAVLVPRAVVLVSNAELQHQLTALPAGVTDLYGIGKLGRIDTGCDLSSAQEIFGRADVDLRTVPAGLKEPLRGALGPVSWVTMFPPDLVSLDSPRLRVQPILRLAVDLHWLERVTFTAGAPPVANLRDRSAPIEFAISQDFADEAGFEVGDEIRYLEGVLRVSGIYTPDHPNDPFWVHAPELTTASISRDPGSPTVVRGAAYIDPVSAVALPTSLERSELRAWYPVRTDTFRFGRLAKITGQLIRIRTLGVYLPSGANLAFQTTLPAELDQVKAAVGTTTAISSLSGSAPLGALLAVLALGTRTVLDRRRSTLTLATARGASQLQLRATMLIEGILIGIPGSLVALVAVVLVVPVPEPVVAAGYALPVLLALAVPLLFAASSPRGVAGRTDLGADERRGRWIVETVIVGAAALALVLLGRRGLVPVDGGVVDPLLAVTPLLLSLAICVVVLRLYPLPLLALQRAARRGRSPVGLVGTSGSLRANTTAFASVLALVVGVSAAIFSLVLVSTVTTGIGTAASSQVGADIRVDAASIGGSAAVTGLPGVRAAAALDTVPGVQILFGRDTPLVTVVFADLAALHEVRPDLPVLTAGEVLLSPDLVSRARGATRLNGHAVTPVGTVSRLGLPGLSRSWVLADIADESAIVGEPPTYGSLLVATRAGANIPATARAVKDVVADSQTSANRDRVEAVDTTTVTADAAARPGIAGLTVALLVAAGLSLLLCALAVSLAALGAARERARSREILRLLGMSGGQLRRVIAWEFAPVTVAALVAGTGFGIALAVIVTTLVDLRSVVGGSVVISPTVPWALVAVTIGGFAVVVAATAAITSAVAARRLSASVAVKMGA
ncbi:ABC transporter permease [Glaciihabitans sp. INWT7]|uniref:FtsX-like permease family protein n=1 Tax=Glaciihabitans sp. INWT7 TaxID=2596912 RepID=UPI001626BC20|nr:FtsX-like permease family protein [Glaciihabitans sp. INWT7]QNE45492.1 ABC transporter permease [Glaciihabitans sp. INWT7]